MGYTNIEDIMDKVAGSQNPVGNPNLGSIGAYLNQTAANTAAPASKPINIPQNKTSTVAPKATAAKPIAAKPISQNQTQLSQTSPQKPSQITQNQLTQQPTQSNQTSDEAEIQNEFATTLKQINEASQEYRKNIPIIMSEFNKSAKAYEGTLDDISKQLKNAPTPPVAKTYADVVKANSDLMPFMTALITLGMAVFGNKTGLSLSDNISAMFSALNSKNLKDYAIAQKDFTNQLLEYKTKVSAFQSKIGDILQLATDGYNVQSQLAELKMNGLQGNLNSLMAFGKMLGTMESNMERIKETTMYHAAEIQLRNEGLGLESGRLGVENNRVNAMIAGINARLQHYSQEDKNEEKRITGLEKYDKESLAERTRHDKAEENLRKKELAAQGGIPGASLKAPQR
jgi:hypothetical protein